MLFHPDLFQVKQTDLSVWERWKEKNSGRRGRMKGREGCSSSEQLGTFLDCYSTLLTPLQTKYSGTWATYFGISDQQHSFRLQA